MVKHYHHAVVNIGDVFISTKFVDNHIVFMLPNGEEIPIYKCKDYPEYFKITESECEIINCRGFVEAMKNEDIQ